MRNWSSSLVAFVLVACSHGPKPFEFGVSSVTPAATGNVMTSTGANGNTVVKVSVHHLSPPDRVVPGATVYVVWAKPLDADGPPTSLGALRVDNNLDGTLDSLTVFRSFDVSITPEATASTPTPTGKVVLDTRISPRG